MEKKEEWEKFKLVDVMGDPAFLGKTVRIGNSIFEIKGVDSWLGKKMESKALKNSSTDFTPNHDLK